MIKKKVFLICIVTYLGSGDSMKSLGYYGISYGHKSAERQSPMKYIDVWPEDRTVAWSLLRKHTID